MTRFSARTSSSQLDGESTIRPIHPVDQPRANLNRKAEPRTPGRPFTGSSRNFVYVGNLRSDVLNADLEQLFKRSGKVTEVVVRCCNGVAVPTTSYQSSCYATVGFSTLEGATQALNMNGQDLLGQSIVVSPSFLGLPEAHPSTRWSYGELQVLGVDFTNLRDTVSRVVDQWVMGGTRILEEDWVD